MKYNADFAGVGLSGSRRTCVTVRGMAAPRTVGCLALAAILLIFAYTKLRFPGMAKAAEEQAVIVKIRLNSADMGSSEERKRIVALEDQLAAAIKESREGEFDGDEFGNGFCTIYIYGPSADRLFAVAQPVLKEFRAPAGSYVIKRHGKPGAKQEHIRLDAEDSPQPK